MTARLARRRRSAGRRMPHAGRPFGVAPVTRRSSGRAPFARPSPGLAALPLARAAVTVACLLVLAAGAYVAVRAVALIAPVVMAVVVALLLAALLGPVSERLKRTGAPAWLAALAGVLGVLLVITGALLLVGVRAEGQFTDLRQQMIKGVQRLRQALTNSPLPITRQQLDRISGEALDGLRRSLPSPVAGATSALEVVAAVILALILLFFLLRDGTQIWMWLVRHMPFGDQQRLAAAGRMGWHSLSSYTHGIMVIAAVDAAGIGAALLILRVPLAFALILLTFVSAFVPIAGATVAGVAATMVTFVTNGPRDALLVLAAVIVVQQAEGHLLHPYVMRRAVRLHPIVTLLAVGTGALLASIAGALVAVPVCAFIYHAVVGYRTYGEATDRPGQASPAPAGFPQRHTEPGRPGRSAQP